MTQRPLRLAHLSDVHVLELQGTPWRAFLNKRATGAVNLLGPRRGAHPTSAADHLAGELAARLRDGRLDHVLITGDLTNLSLESEYRAARAVVVAAHTAANQPVATRPAGTPPVRSRASEITRQRCPRRVAGTREHRGNRGR